MTRRLVASTPGETDGQQCFLVVVLFYFSLKKKKKKFVENKEGYLLILQERSRSKMHDVTQEVKTEALFSSGKGCCHLVQG